MKRALLSLVLVGCNSATVAPVPSSTTAPVAPAATSPVVTPSTTPASPTTLGACASDAECRTFSSYCPDSPCGCRALSAHEADPACEGSKVRCFADPCMRKTPACQSGKCVVTAK